MNDADDADRVVVFDVAIDNKIGKHDPYADMRPEPQARLATFGIIGKPFVKVFNASVVFERDKIGRIAGNIGQHLRRVRVGEVGDDNARH